MSRGGIRGAEHEALRGVSWPLGRVGSFPYGARSAE
jgi:hypothetical protein